MDKDIILFRLKMELGRSLKSMGFSEGAILTQLRYILSEDYKQTIGKNVYVDLRSIDKKVE